MQIGIVKWFNASKGLGFITPTDGSEDLLVHAAAIEGSGDALYEGQEVEFEALQTKVGWQAKRVRVRSLAGSAA